MARLIVRLHGEDVSKITLETGIEYIAGRAQDAQIVLNGERGISRHHLKFYEKDGHWVCESLSKYVQLQRGTESVQILELDEPSVFTVSPYEFRFELNDEKVAPGKSEKLSENLPAFYQPRTSQQSADSSSGGMGEYTTPRANNEATVAGVASSLVPYFRISYPNTADDEVLKLEGHLWVAGRDPSCEIPIESPHISRKHFELARTKEGFFITDLGSSNGTKINGQRIPPHEPTRLESGDELQIKNIEMIFEIRDTGFNQRLDRLPAVAHFDPGLQAAPAPWYPPNQEFETEYREQEESFPKKWKDVRWRHLKALGPKKLIVRGSLVIGLPILIVVAMMPDKPKSAQNRDPASPAGKESLSFEKLTNEQRLVVKDSFNLARNLYVQGKYDICLAELAKLKELIPQYENSEELRSFCEQGHALVIRQQDLDRKNREREEIERRISGYVEGCKDKLKDASSVDETRTCLSGAMELDPEHHLIIEMIHSAQMREEEQKLLQSQQVETDKKVQRGMAHFARAQTLYRKGLLAKAVAEYERFINTSYPRSESIKGNARREVASIKKELKTKVDTLIEQCKSLGAKNRYREACAACDHAIEEDPDNTIAREARAQIVAELKRDLKGVYEDSVLEESLGNVDSAKEKWKKIIKDDLDNGEYAVKARSKLLKYGVAN